MKTCRYPFISLEGRVSFSRPTKHNGQKSFLASRLTKPKISLLLLHKDAPLLVGCQLGDSFPSDSIMGCVRRPSYVNVEGLLEQMLQGPWDTENPLLSLTDASSKPKCSDEVNVIILQSCRMTAEFSSFDQDNHFLLEMLGRWGGNKVLWPKSSSLTSKKSKWCWPSLTHDTSQTIPNWELCSVCSMA